MTSKYFCPKELKGETVRFPVREAVSEHTSLRITRLRALKSWFLFRPTSNPKVFRNYLVQNNMRFTRNNLRGP